MQIEVILSKCPKTPFVEFTRQSAHWLKSRFNFERSLGYSILGRRSYEDRSASIFQSGTLNFVGVPKHDIGEIYLTKYSAHSEINIAAKMIQDIWSKTLESGPVNLSYDEFLSYTLPDKLKLLREGKFAVMCQGVRDLFLHASAGINIKARGVGAYNYLPLLGDLITYGHSTAEVWVEDLGKWAIVDPWLGFTLVTKDGILVSAEDIHAKNVSVDDTVVVPIIESMKRIYTGASGDSIHFEFRPKDSKLSDYSSTELGNAPGYFAYFNNIIYRDFLIAMPK